MSDLKRRIEARRVQAPEGALFAEGFRTTPFWHEGLPALPALADAPPQRADVAVIGAGFTGLHAALETARAGRETVVIEAGDPGAGCSTRNGAHISASIKPSLGELTRRYGELTARAIRAEGRGAIDWLERFVAAEGIDCGFRRAGRFLAAHSPAAYAELGRTAEALWREERVEVHAVPRAEQARELGTGYYHGGLVYPRYATIHPARYHRGLLERVRAAGARIVAHCPATAIAREGDGFAIVTAAGTVRARNVVVATNGYTGALTPWLRRRVVPIGSYVIATEPLAPGLMARLFPTGRMACDTRRVVYYYGPDSARERIVFGGRVSAGEIDDRESARRLHAEMVRIFPELRDTRVSHAWHGTVAYSFDRLAHTGCHEGIHYAMGYCGSGVSMSGYLGMRAGQKVLGRAEGRTPLDDLPFPTRPLYRGRPWFLPAAVAWYRCRDALDCGWARMRDPRVP